MPFSDYFKLNSDPAIGTEPFKQLFAQLEPATNMINCYQILFNLFISALKFQSETFRHQKLGAAAPTPLDPAKKPLFDLVLSELDPTLLLEDDDLTLFERAVFEPVDEPTPPPPDYKKIYFHFPIKSDSAFETIVENVQVYLKYLEANNLNKSLNKLFNTQGLPFPAQVPDAEKLNPAAINNMLSEDTKNPSLKAWIQAHNTAYQGIQQAITAKTFDAKFTLSFIFDRVAVASGFFQLSDSPDVNGLRLQAMEHFCDYWGKVDPAASAPLITYLDSALDASKAPCWDKPFLSKSLTAFHAAVADKKSKAAYKKGSVPREQFIFIRLYQFFETAFSTVVYPGEASDAQVEQRQRDISEGVLAVLLACPPAVTGFSDSIFDMANFLSPLINANLFLNEIDRLVALAASAVPGTLFDWQVEYLKQAADNLLSLLPLQYLEPLYTGGAKDPNVQLFPFVSYDTIAGSGVVSVPGSHTPLTDGPYFIVKGDPITPPPKTGQPFIYDYRPIWYYNPADKKVTICNLWDSQLVSGELAGNIFFFEDTTPGVVRLNVVKDLTYLGHQYPEGAELLINFIEGTINGNKRDTANQPYLTTTPTGGRSIVKLIDQIKALTLWRLEAVITYLPYYQTLPAGPAKPFGNLRREMPEGRGTGIGRADRIPQQDILWEWLAPDPLRGDYRFLPNLLELPVDRELAQPPGLAASAATVKNIGGKPYNVERQDQLFFQGSFQYTFLTLTSVSDPSLEPEYFVRVNTPRDFGNISVKATSRPIILDDARILGLFQFAYYRRVERDKAGRFKIVKTVSDEGKRPRAGDGVPLPKKGVGTTSTRIGLNFPVSFQIDANTNYFKAYIHGVYEIKNKGSILSKAKSLRNDAGSVMSAINNPVTLTQDFHDALNKRTTTGKLSATIFSNAAIQFSQVARKAWQATKNTLWETLTTDQEWCHLQGHGDGGGERLGNFVSGSHYCNTEQLAMEEGLRHSTHAADTGNKFYLKSTAYLLRDTVYGDGKKPDYHELIQQDYLDTDGVYKSLLEGNKLINAAAAAGLPPSEGLKQVAAAKDAGAKKKAADIAAPATLPIAAFIRYKVIQANAKGFAKRWDYTFEGQSEFFDRAQYLIVNKSMEFRLKGPAAFHEWYTERVAAAKYSATLAD